MISKGEQVELTHAQNSFGLTFNVQNYSLVNQVEYVYMLKGLENSWYTVNENNSVTFRNIPPGNMSFLSKRAFTTRNGRKKPPPWLSGLTRPFGSPGGQSLSMSWYLPALYISSFTHIRKSWIWKAFTHWKEESRTRTRIKSGTPAFLHQHHTRTAYTANLDSRSAGGYAKGYLTPGKTSSEIVGHPPKCITPAQPHQSDIGV